MIYTGFYKIFWRTLILGVCKQKKFSTQEAEDPFLKILLSLA